MTPRFDGWISMWSRFSRRRLAREVDEELSFHMDMLTEKYRSQGMDPEAAAEAARDRFGNDTFYRQAALRAEGARIKKQNRALVMDHLVQDIRFAFRQLWKRPVFSAIALGMLGLGIGANTAIFSVVHNILLRPLPFQEPDRIVRIWESRVDRGWDRASVAPGNFWDFRDLNHAFEDLGAYRFSSANLTGEEFPERLDVGRVTAGFFGEVLGVRPVAGRTFLSGEDDPTGDSRIALLGNQFWLQRFGGDPGALHDQLILDGETYQIVGILPPGRPWLDYADVFVPMVRNPNDTRSSFELAVIGRMLPGMTLENATSDLGGIARRLEESFPEQLAGIGVSVGSSSEWIATPETRRALWVLLGAVGFLLMIACVNLANLFLARATSRTRETAIRAATGASRGRLLRQTLTESLVVSLLGATIGLVLALWGVDTLTAVAPDQIPGLAESGVNLGVLGFSLSIGILTGLATGLVPALQSSGKDSASTLRAGSQGIAGNRLQQRLRGGLVAAEVALSLILLVGSGLLIRSFNELLSAEKGFETENRIVATVNVPDSYGDQEFVDFNRQLVARVRSLGPVVNAAAVHIRPLSGGSTGLGFVRPDQPEPEGGIPWASWRLITPGYFETMGVPILRGRDFTDDDPGFFGDGAIQVVISQRIAEQLWPGEDPLGRAITLWAGQGDNAGEVIGVVGDMRERGIDAGPTFAVYFPYVDAGWPPDLVVHTAGDPTTVLPGIRSILREMDPNLPLSDVATMDEMVGQSVGGDRFMTVLVSIFACLALLLALAGVYGVQSYSVAQQTPEIGIRVAMGASRSRILWKVVLQAMRPTVMGIAAGSLGAILLSRFMASLLFQVEATDPATYVGVTAVLLVAALMSALVPAFRASRVDPVIAFRAE